MTINVLMHPATPSRPAPADEPAAAEPASGSHDPEPDNSAAAHARRKLLDVAAFEQAERLALGAKQAAFEKAAAKLQALGNGKTGADYDKCNFAVRAAEVLYLETTIEAAAKFGIHGGWKTTLANLPPVVTHATWMAGKGKW